jgi:FkbM family methyltransferase
MDDKQIKKIEIKNIADILAENLRIINEPEENYEEESSLFSEEETNIEILNLRNTELGNKILKTARNVLHREIRHWIIQPLQTKQTAFNRKTVKNVEKINDELHENVEKINKKLISLENKIELIKNVDNESEIKIIVKQKFLEILKRYPNEQELDYFVNEIKTQKINIIDFERKLLNNTEYKNVKLLEHCCIYTKYGTKMYLDKLDNVVSKDLAVNQIWEPNETKILQKIIQKDMNVIDIGANIGYYTILFSKWVGDKGKIFSFEPESENFRLLKKNINANKANNVITFQKAVSNQNESKTLFLSEENKGDHQIIDLGENRTQIGIECTKLDSTIAAEHKIDLIKMDIQGAEMLALEGMNKILENNSKMTILMEFWPYGIEKSGYNPKNLLEKLEKYGFKIFLIKDEGIIPISKNFSSSIKYSNEEYYNLICKKG